MLEIPETKTISRQVNETLKDKVIEKVLLSNSPHKFTFYNGDPAEYVKLLQGKKILSAHGHGMFVDVHCENDTCITISDGTNMRFYLAGENTPEKYQLLISFNDKSFIAFTVAMYGSIYAFKGTLDNSYHRGSLNSLSPLENDFNEAYFDSIFKSVSKDISLKALLATEQRIPGLGNGCLQDILLQAGLHPKQKKNTISDLKKSDLFHSLKTTLAKMTEMGGRDTEKDFFGRAGAYKTLLSKNTLANPCPFCGNTIHKEQYLGGAIYFCPVCQAL
ncbi:MAG: endonuclease VIII [Bacteroidales bacterium]|nr:endonuclease VIII [Bacteroidales bacterium]